MAQWWQDEAEALGKRLGSSSGAEARPVLFETGYGPSGLPHLGTFAEVARTAFVRWAFRQRFPERPTRQLAFSDDMDGLRSVPENVPNRELLTEHLARPLCDVPDPFGEAESFSAHMVGKLKHFLGAFGFDTEFMSSSEAYRAGAFDVGLQRLLERDEQVKSVVLPTLQPETRRTWSPFLPICEACGRYTTRVVEVRPDQGTLVYRCDTDFGGAQGCGHAGEVSVAGGRVKVGWKVDWALRWAMLGVDYEMYGKDLIESANISNKLVKLIGGKPPMGTFYELFLDEEGRKISKKIGNGIAFGAWREYSPDDAILYFLTKPPRKARRIGLELVSRSVDELLALLRLPDEDAGRAEVVEMMSAVAPGIDRPHGWRWRSGFDYGLVVGLVAALGLRDAETIERFFVESPAVALDPADRPFTRALIDSALRYQDALDARRAEVSATAEPPSPRSLDALRGFRAALEQAPFDDAEALQNLTFETSRAHDLPAKAWFGLLYDTLTGNASGPRLGTLLSMLGRDRALHKLDARITVGSTRDS